MMWFSIMSAIAAGIAIGNVLSERYLDALATKEEYVTLARKHRERVAREAQTEVNAQNSAEPPELPHQENLPPSKGSQAPTALPGREDRSQPRDGCHQ